jgi:regulatory protein
MSFNRRKKPAQPLTSDEILDKAQHFCAYQERSPQELRKKLADLGADTALAEEIYAVLAADNFINEERFAGAFAGGKFRINRWGRVRIRMGLRQHGISEQVAAAALAGIDTAEYGEVMAQLAGRKRRELEGDPNARQKLAAYLIRAGFEPELVWSYI